MRLTKHETGRKQGVTDEINSVVCQLAEEAIQNYEVSNGSFDGAARLVVLIIGPGKNDEASCGSSSQDIFFG